MTYLYNNIRVHEFQSQKRLISKSHAELSMLQSRIAGWNEVLHKKESKQNSSELELGIMLDLEDLRQKILRMISKLKYLNEYPEDALQHATILEKIYLWLHSNINHIYFMKEDKLAKLEENLKKGTYFISNSLIEYYIDKYRKEKNDSIITTL